MRLLTVIWALIRANAWCLRHPGHSVRTEDNGKTIRVSTGTGGVLRGTWQTAKVFYDA